ncbi:hypothetical protein M378DRAFT_436135 [Amanita muscaria Koide BX008]|uniref:Uncharacterized protein n=1 Tax=Amanita muscaria (strain Koide BX008) TaxID=946122 RepID=A0A0C2S2G6_AMAMK|nr:hypothetical protein M378DRAFT_436135 [Amanita muscaria Koide BX008]
MGEKVRDRIVGCARHGKIKTIANLERETKWTGAVEFGSEILGIIEKHYPSPIIDLTVLPAMQSPFAEPELPDKAQVQIHEAVPCPAKRQVTCSLCGGQGHTMRSKKRCSLQNGQKDNFRAPGSSTSPASALLPSAPITPTSVLPSPGPTTLSSPLLSPSLSPIFASTLSASTRSTLSTLSPSTIASLASHLNSISLSSTKPLNRSN